MLTDDKDVGLWERVRSQQLLGTCGLRGTPEDTERHQAQEQAIYDEQLARYVARGGWGYL